MVQNAAEEKEDVSRVSMKSRVVSIENLHIHTSNLFHLGFTRE